SRNLTGPDEMALLLRTVRQHRWLKQEAAPFLEQDDVPADAVGDLVTQQNLLSVWEVAPDRSNIERIVRAVAIGRDQISHIGYMLFDSDLLPSEGIETIANTGVSLDQGANPWHRDLVLSGRKLVALTKVILQHGETGAVLKVRLRELIEEGIAAKQIPEK